MDGDSPMLSGRLPHANTSPDSSRPKVLASPKRSHNGRVRTGCLVCRARKVKCDEERPTCRKCARLRKQCVYKLPGRPVLQLDLNQGQHSQQNPQPTESVQHSFWLQTDAPDHTIVQQCVPSANASSPSTQGILGLSNNSKSPDPHVSISGSSDELSPDQSTDNLNQDPSLAIFETVADRFQRTSHLIYLSTVVDWMAASEAPTASSFGYFIDEVDCPLLSPFDHTNWLRVKQHIAYLGFQQSLIAESILAVQVVYRAQVDRLSMTHAMSVYKAAVANFESVSGNDVIEFDIILIIAFLVCLCVVTLPNEDGPHLTVFDGPFVTRLEHWLMGSSHTPVSLRICAWLQLLNTNTKHPGSVSLLPTPVLNILYDRVRDVPGLSSLDCGTHPERCLYDAVAAPIFAFYLRLQRMSNRVADVTHYRRSRTTPEDQAEVVELMDALKTELSSLWENRPAPLQIKPREIRDHFSAQISDPLIALSGICTAAFYAEIIVIGRILGDSPFPSSEAKQPLEQIRSIVDGDRILITESGLNPGYVRPLFVYALESFGKEEAQWAADRLREIRHPSSRSNFLASFVEAHGEAQRTQSRRVTMKYFCYQTFGVPLPFM